MDAVERFFHSNYITMPIWLLCLLGAATIASAIIPIVLHKEVKRKVQNCGLVFFIGYYLVVLCMTVFCRNVPDNSSINLLPFSAYQDYFNESGEVLKAISMREILINIYMFIPIGVFVCICARWKRSIQMMVVCIVLSSLIEILQLLLHRGVCELNDIINNTIGALTGIVVAEIVKAGINYVYDFDK